MLQKDEEKLLTKEEKIAISVFKLDTATALAEPPANAAAQQRRSYMDKIFVGNKASQPCLCYIQRLRAKLQQREAYLYIATW